MHEERDELFCRVVEEFARAKVSFEDQLTIYRKTGKVDFARLDRFVEQILFDLKEDCHFLFRKTNHHQPTEEISCDELFDISVGSIFHELMKLKENVYQLEYYAPLYSVMSKTADKPEAPVYERDFIDACSKIVRRARRNLPSDLNAAEELFHDAADNLRMMLHEHINNPLLARMLIDQQDLMKQTFEIEHIDVILNDIYEGKLDEAHLAAARDYLAGGWYNKAHREAEIVLQFDSDNIEAQQIIRKLNAKQAAMAPGEGEDSSCSQ